MTWRVITSKDVTKFLKAKKIDPTCSKCGFPKWSMENYSDTNKPYSSAILAFSNEAPDILTNRAFPTITMSCNNCGNIWQIRSSIIEEWLAADGGAQNG